MKNLNIFSSVTEYDNAKSRGVLNVPNISFINEDSSVRYLIDIKIKYDYVDLGLPSGLKWATCNVGATSPEEYGLYFAWGETTGYTANDVTSGVRGFTDDEYNAGPAASIDTDLTLEQDAAHVNMGGNWRMPTQTEYQELLDNCDGVWTENYNGTGVNGCIFTSKVNGNSVFFPTAGRCDNSYMLDVGSQGFYWPVSWYDSSNAWGLFLDPGVHDINPFNHRYFGQSVRGVFK